MGAADCRRLLPLLPLLPLPPPPPICIQQPPRPQHKALQQDQPPSLTPLHDHLVADPTIRAAGELLRHRLLEVRGGCCAHALAMPGVVPAGQACLQPSWGDLKRLETGTVMHLAALLAASTVPCPHA